MDHKDLDIWKESMEAVTAIYKITKSFPKEEIYGLASQLRRAGISIPSNIAEGAARTSDKEFVQYLYVSLGSLAEVETQILIAERLGYINHSDDIFRRLSSIKQMILGLIKYLKGKEKK